MVTRGIPFDQDLHRVRDQVLGSLGVGHCFKEKKWLEEHSVFKKTANGMKFGVN